jgi:hypothetical protein
MAKNNKKQALAVAQVNGISLTKDNVPALIKHLEDQLDALQGKTDKSISTDVVYNGTNISKITKLAELLEISASIHARGKAYQEEVKRYGLSDKRVASFKTNERTVEEWSAIIAKAINELLNSKQITQLKDSIAKLSNHVDAETKLQRELAGIMNSATEEIE